MRTSTIQTAEQIYRTRSHKVASGDDAEWIVAPSFNETRKVLGKSFAGTDDIAGEPVCDWGVNHIGDWMFDNNREEYRKMLEFGLGFPIYGAIKDERSFLISKRDNVTGEIISASAIVEYNPETQGSLGTKFLEGWRTLKAFLVLMMQAEKVPKLFADKQYKAECDHFEKKMKHALICTTKWHKEEGPKEVHWYIPTVGAC